MFHMVSEEMIFKDILPFFAFWLPWQQSKSGLDSKIFCLAEDHSMFHMVSEQMIFIDIFFLFFAFMLPWQPVKMSTEQNNHLLLNEHF